MSDPLKEAMAVVDAYMAGLNSGDEAERTPIHVGPDKVHLKVAFSRWKADGSLIGRFGTIYIVSRQDGHWGIQARSSFAS
jgi:hypothetical protein